MYKECRQCGLTTEYEGVLITSNGICNFCESFNKNPPSGSIKCMKNSRAASLKRLNNLFQMVKLRQDMLENSYDVLAMVSGGKDSIYMLYELVKRHKLRPLVFTIDIGVEPPAALENVRRAIKKLGLFEKDWICYKSSIAKKIFAPYFKNKKLWQNISVCVWCNFFKKVFGEESRKTAVKFHIPLVIAGNDYEYFKESDTVFNTQRKIAKTFIAKHPNLVAQDQMVSYQELRKKYPHVYWLEYWREVWRSVEKGVKLISEELDWQNIRQSPFTSEFFCKAVVARYSLHSKDNYVVKKKEIGPSLNHLLNSVRIKTISLKTMKALSSYQQKYYSHMPEKEEVKKLLSYFK